MLAPYLTGSLVDAGNVDLGDELKSGWLVWILVAAVDVDAVDTVLVCALPSGISYSNMLSVFPYAFQILLTASVTPTSFVSNSYRPTAVVRVKARRSQLHRE